MTDTRMASLAKLPPEQRVSGHASFLHRGSPWWQRLQMAVADALVAVFGVILFLGGRPLRRLVVRGLSGLAYRIMRGKQKIIRTNLKLVFGDELDEAQTQRLIRDLYTHFTRGLLDLLFDWVYWRPRDIEKFVTADGRRILHELQARGQGSSIVACHLGNPDLALKLVRSTGFDLYVMYKSFRSPWFDRFIARKRLKVGSGLIEVPGSRHRIVNGKRELVPDQDIGSEIRALWSRNICVGFLADQYAKRNPLYTTVMGVPDTPTQAGAWRYVVENRIPVVLVSAVYTDDGDLEWTCSEIMDVEDQGDPQTTLVHHMQRADDWFEKEIRKNPAQYFWGHRRFARHHYEA